VLDITLLGCYEFSQLDLGKSNKPQTWKRWLNLARSPDRLNETNTSLLSEETKADSGYCAVLLDLWNGISSDYERCCTL